ncbi:TIGR01906 family membrane protein [Candidatus Woesearchaeota archaeon]|nr:TIGR01906 family membrane protein [Candidatus Woesearchaeota archaeon]
MQLNKTKTVITAILLGTLIFLISIYTISQSKSFMTSEFEKYNIYDNFNDTNYSKFEINNNALNLLDYLTGKKNNLDNTFFNEKEKIHSKDVKNIFQGIKITIFILFPVSIGLVFLWYRKNMLHIYKPYILTFIVDGVIIIILTILAKNFEMFFLQFHKLAFNNNLWLMNPKTDLMIRLFPEIIFKDAFVRVIIYTIMISFVFFIFGMLLYQQQRMLKPHKLTTKKK